MYLEDVLALTGYVLKPDSAYRVQDSATWQRQTFEVHNSRAGGTTQTVVQEWKEVGSGPLNPDYDADAYPNHPETVHEVLKRLNEHAINIDLICELIAYIDVELEEGAILIFVPGIVEITAIVRQLEISRQLDPERFVLLSLHSTLTSKEQQAVFRPVPPGVRKVVVATNIAETSITIDDAVFVIDTGRAKVSMYDERKMMRRLVEQWISRAEAKQRAGRAGRVRPGHAFKLYTRRREEERFIAARIPGMLRAPLQDLCLQLRLSSLLGDYDLRSAFARALDPPSEAGVSAAISALQRTGALDAAEALTPLGRQLASLPCDVSTGRLVLYGALFRCIDPILIIAAALSDKLPFQRPLEQKADARSAQMSFNREVSDHLALWEAYRQWQIKRAEGGKAASRSFANKHFLFEKTLEAMSDTANQLWQNLADVGLLPDLNHMAPEQRERARAVVNKNSGSPVLVKAILAAGLFPNVLRAVEGKSKPALYQQKLTVSISSSSLNEKAPRFDTHFLVYHEKVKTHQIVVHDCTAVTALDIMLFGSEMQVMHAQHRAVLDGWIELHVPPRVAVLVKALRRQLTEVMRRRIAEVDRRKREGWTTSEYNEDSEGQFVLDQIVNLIKSGVGVMVDGVSAPGPRGQAARAGPHRGG